MDVEPIGIFLECSLNASRKRGNKYDEKNSENEKADEDDFPIPQGPKAPGVKFLIRTGVKFFIRTISSISSTISKRNKKNK